MWAQQEGIDKLVTIIQQLQLQRETGQLVALHGTGITEEEGTIVFVNGKVTEARIGQRTGSHAFNRLSSWENCTCYFVRPTGMFNQVSFYALNKAPNKFASAPTNTYLMPSIYKKSLQPQIDFPQKVSNRRQVNVPTALAIPHPLVQIPVAMYKIEQMQLTRSHRHLFLLIDGQRSVTDLMRLIGKGEEEVYILLYNLAYMAIISFYLP